MALAVPHRSYNRTRTLRRSAQLSRGIGDWSGVLATLQSGRLVARGSLLTRPRQVFTRSHVFIRLYAMQLKRMKGRRVMCTRTGTTLKPPGTTLDQISAIFP